MIRAFTVEGGRLRGVELTAERSDVMWADLLAPTRAEETLIEEWVGIGIPTREEMEEIEISSRLYVEDDALFMTATLPAQTEDDHPMMSPVTFVLARGRLITIRYHDPRAFETFPARAEKVSTGCTNGESILIGLLEAIVDRLADVLERSGRDIDALSHDIFQSSETKANKRDRNFQKVLQTIGRKEGLTSDLRESLMTLQRLSGFLGNALDQDKHGKELRARVKVLTRDVMSLADHVTFLSQKITFLLDATLGMINIEQNGIIKIFSVAAVVFLPPTLVASVYGMNFEIMPELQWSLGYPLALGLMVLSAILPFWYFKRRGWL